MISFVSTLNVNVNTLTGLFISVEFRSFWLQSKTGNTFISISAKVHRNFLRSKVNPEIANFKRQKDAAFAWYFELIKNPFTLSRKEMTFVH